MGEKLKLGVLRGGGEKTGKKDDENSNSKEGGH